ncbi:hypothetical protein CASFOL_030496 [Castilleja foliolosa]|uniref:Basic blue protein n=1 Tax=Castilleja foliolosa TaxID=1961234 RepID=A0ABD3BCL7_9LAMI
MFGEKTNSMVVAILLLGLLLHCGSAQAKIYNVGDAMGWDYGADEWNKGKSFKAGDILVFKYDVGAHNVAVVDKANYDSCTAPSNAKIYASGNDRVTLKKGTNYFICTFPTHCDFGMKISAFAA